MANRLKYFDKCVTVTGPGTENKTYTFQKGELSYYIDGSTLVMWDKKNPNKNLIKAEFSEILNDNDSGNAFASAGALASYLQTNFFFELGSPGGGGGTWGSITGDIGDQSDLQSVLDAKVDIQQAPATVGTLLNETFAGVAINSSNWSNALPTGASINNKLIIASGASDWSRYIQSTQHFLSEKVDYVVNIKAVTKNAGDGIGIFQAVNHLTPDGTSIHIKADLHTGIVSIGNTTAANEYGSTSACVFSAGDNLRLTISRTPWKTAIRLENTTTTTAAQAYGLFDLIEWEREGYPRLAFLGGQQEITSITVTSHARDFGGTGGVVFLGHSSAKGWGATTPDRRYASIAMKGQDNLFEVVAAGSWLSGTFLANSRLTEFLSPINGKYLVVDLGYNDANVSFGVSAATLESNLISLASTAQGLGYTVIFLSLFPSPSNDYSAHNTAVQNAATTSGSKFIDLWSLFELGTTNRIDPQYLGDPVHLNDLAHRMAGEKIATEAPEILTDYLSALSVNAFGGIHQFKPMKDTDMIIGRSTKGEMTAGSRRDVFRDVPRLQSAIYEVQTGSGAISGSWQVGERLLIKGNTAGINFNNGVDDTNGTNFEITNEGTGGVGYPAAWSNITGKQIFRIYQTQSKGGFSSNTISGTNAFLFNTQMLPSGQKNIAMIGGPVGTATGDNCIYIGEHAGKGITASNGWNLHILASDGYVPTNTSNVENSIWIGGSMATSENPIQSGDILIGLNRYHAQGKFWIGGRTGAAPIVQFSSDVWSSVASNVAATPASFRAPLNSGTAESYFDFATPIPVASGTTMQSAWSSRFRVTNSGIYTPQSAVIGGSSFAGYTLDVQGTLRATGNAILSAALIGTGTAISGVGILNYGSFPIVGNQISGSGTAGFNFYNSAGTNIGGVQLTGSSGEVRFFAGAGGYFPTFYSNNTERLRISTGGLFQFGGTSASFPAIKRASATLEFRLADDSDYAEIVTKYLRSGTGTPEGNVTAPVGTLYRRTDGGAGTTLYVKESGTGNTGWVAK